MHLKKECFQPILLFENKSSYLKVVFAMVRRICCNFNAFLNLNSVIYWVTCEWAEYIFFHKFSSISGKSCFTYMHLSLRSVIWFIFSVLCSLRQVSETSPWMSWNVLRRSPNALEREYKKTDKYIFSHSFDLFAS